MPTLTIDGAAFEVVGAADWSTGGMVNGQPQVAFIEAMIQVPADVPTHALDNVNVRVELDAGTRFIEGDDMWRAGSLVVTGDGFVLVRYEGAEVRER